MDLRGPRLLIADHEAKCALIAQNTAKKEAKIRLQFGLVAAVNFGKRRTRTCEGPPVRNPLPNRYQIKNLVTACPMRCIRRWAGYRRRQPLSPHRSIGSDVDCGNYERSDVKLRASAELQPQLICRRLAQLNVELHIR